MAHREVHNAIVKVCRSVEESLPDILIFEFRIFLAQLLSVPVESRQFHHTTNGQTHMAHARLTIHTSGINSYAIKYHPDLLRLQ
jgi:hypothetical protein